MSTVTNISIYEEEEEDCKAGRLYLFSSCFTLNVTSTMKFSLGGSEVEARNGSMTCWSQIKFNMQYSTVWCPGCEAKPNWRGESGEGTCSGDPGST